MKPFVVLGCGKTKKAIAPGATCPAIELYSGQLFAIRRKYAEAVCGGVDVIVSARYGVLRPDQEIETYELNLNDCDKETRAKWAATVAKQLVPLVPVGSTVVLLCSGPYAKFSTEHEMRGRVFLDPLPGPLRFAKAMQFLNNEIKRHNGKGG